MSFVEAFEQTPVLGPDQIPATAPRAFGERFDLNWKSARSPDQFWFYESRMAELYGDALDKLNRATGQSLPNPFSYKVEELPPEQRVSKAAPGRDRESLRTQVHDAFDKAREMQHDLPDPRQFDFKVAGEARTLRADAERSALNTYGAGGLGAFIGAAVGELSHPVQLATLPFGATYAAGNIARLGTMAFIGRALAIEGGIALGTQAAVEAINTPYQEELRNVGPGSGNESGDRISRILMAGAGGALFGTGLAGLVAAARAIRLRGKVAPTLDEADALKVAERQTTFEDRNPLGPSGEIAHSDALKKAEVDVSAGRHADVDEIVRGETRRQLPEFERVNDVADIPEVGHPPGIKIYGDKEGRYRIFKDGERAGFLNLDETKRAVDGVQINEKFRRQGLASQLYTAAEQDLGYTLKRSSSQTLEGKAFREAYDQRRELLAERGPGAKPFDILDPAPARQIAEKAPVVPEKAQATAVAEAHIANATRAAETHPDVPVTPVEGGKTMRAADAMAEASEEVKAANVLKNCAMGII